jgi:negative regulator of flagellin synthesis FlgM
MKIGQHHDGTASPRKADKPAAARPGQAATASATAASASAANAGAAAQTAAASKAAAPEASAQVAISSTAAKLINTNVQDDGSFDAAKVSRISQAIADGKFKVDANAIADKLISNAQELVSRANRQH